jgi:hypothetical protein
LESDLATRMVDYEADPATIEHILPENPSSLWDTLFPPQRQDAFIYRLGNLTLLEATSNRQVGNQSYTEKLSAYQESTYRLSNSIASSYPEEWTPAALQGRQQWMAERAAHIWRIDY